MHRRVQKLLFPLILSALPSAVLAQAVPTYPFQDPSLPTAQRVDDLVSRLTLPEKVSQMVTDAAAIPRLGIPKYYWWSESLHGNAFSGLATVFPEPIGLAASFDLGLESQVATATSDENRGKYNQTVLDNKPAPFRGLTFFAPNINIFRDPRWGRGQETYGEDPYLTAEFGVTFVQGLQGNDPKYLKTVATPKHFAVHSGPEPERHRFDAVVSDYDLHDTYLPAFQAAVERGHAQSIMGAYSAVDGVPDCASPLLLQTNLRQGWGFDGYVVSDCDAIADIYGGHHYTDSLPAAAAAGVKAGCDLDCGGAYSALNDAVKQGLITEAEIDVSVKRLFTERMRLGMFDPPAQVAYSKIPYSVIDSPAHRKLAIQAARETIVLLKNEKNTLPLSSKIKSLAVIGPNADDVGVLLGNYNGTPSHAVTALEGLQKHVGSRVHIEYVQGTGLTGLSETTAIPTDALTAGGKPGLQGEYFAGEDLSGMPKAVRQDPKVQFTWSGSGPGLGLTQFHYSVRWAGELIAPAAGEYTLAVSGDDGFRLFVNDQKVIDDWGIHPTETKNATVTLKAGQHVPIRLEYYQAEGDAEITLQWRQPVQTPYADAIAAAKRADAVVFVGGISSKLEGEEGTNGGGDRTSLDLPDVQEKLLEALQAAGKPVILVLMNGSAMSVNWADSHLPAIVESWYPGEEGGTALAEVLFGDYDPAGRLPVTFYKSVDQLPPFTDYAMKDRTYRYFNGEPLYKFGYGLSYTQFRYTALKMPREVKEGQSVTVTAEVENVGPREGDEVSELYLRPAPDAATRDVAPGQPMPRLILAGFARTHLAPHQRRTVSFMLTPEQLHLVDARGERTLQPGDWQIYVGGHQPSLTEAKGIVSGPLRVQ
jgi:beta-glucosidase